MRTFFFTLCAILLCLSVKAETSKKEFLKNYSKEGVNEVMISSRSGQIEVDQVEGNQIEIAATIAVTAKTGSKADELLEFIHINDTQTGAYINVETVFGKDMTFKQLLSGVEINVSYKVKIPTGIKLRLVNTEGNVFVNDFDGDLTVDIKSGNFKAEKIKGEKFYIKQTSGNFDVSDVATMTGEFKSCNLKIEEGNEVNLDANSCTGNLQSITTLNIRSNGGELKLGQIEMMMGSASSTKLEVQDIGDMLKMDMRMGELNVRNIHFNFSTVEVKGSYTKVGLTFMEGAGYELEFKHTKSVRMDLPRGIQLTERPTAEKNIIVETGFVGDKKYKGKVFLDLRNGNMYIQ